MLHERFLNTVSNRELLYLNLSVREREKEKRVFKPCANSETAEQLTLSSTLIGLSIISIEKCCILKETLKNIDDSHCLLLSLRA